jgi:hypothetical protein
MSGAGSSVSIVSEYELDDRDILRFDPRQRQRILPLACVQTGSGAHPACYPRGTGGPFAGVKERQGCDTDHSPPSSAEVMNEYELYLLSFCAFMVCSGTTLLYCFSQFYHARKYRKPDRLRVSCVTTTSLFRTQ